MSDGTSNNWGQGLEEGIEALKVHTVSLESEVLCTSGARWRLDMVLH